MDAHAALPYLESYFDPKTFTFELDALGLKLTATRMVDGTIRINRWHMHEVWSNERRVNNLWERMITGRNRQVLAEFLLSDEHKVYSSG